MPYDLVKLTIEGGAPGQSVRVIERDRGDEPPAPVLECGFDGEGRVSIVLPRGYYVVLVEGADAKSANFLATDGPKSLVVGVA